MKFCGSFMGLLFLQGPPGSSGGPSWVHDRVTARRGLGGAKFVEARPPPAPADAGLDFAGYAAQLAFDDGAPGLVPLDKAGELDGKLKSARAL